MVFNVVTVRLKPRDESHHIEIVIHLKTAIFPLLIGALIESAIAQAASSTAEPSTHSFLSNVADALDATWQSKDYEWYIPINTWHNRNSYTHAQISTYNEQPWGIGVGKYRYDQDGDWHGLYAMVFLDSKSQWEPIVGYGFQKVWQPNEALRLGLGYTVGLTLRSDLHYLPLPLFVPLISIKYQSVALQSTYIPGAGDIGNVLFTWIRWEMQ